MSLRGIFQQLGFWTTILSWQEPSQYRTRLRGDTLVRLGLAAAIGSVPMTLLLVLFAINVNPPHPAFALVGFLIGATLAGVVLFMGESSAGGAVRICQEGIHRKRMFIPRIPVHMGIEEASWPYESISRAMIVPGQAIGQSFSVLLLTDEVNVEIVGIPGRTSLEQLAQVLASRGVRVESGAFIPESYRRPIGWPIAAAAGLVGLVLAVGGLGFYGIKTLGRGGPVARAPVARQMDEGPPPILPRPISDPPTAPPPPPRQQATSPPPPASAPTDFPTIPSLPRPPRPPAGKGGGTIADPFSVPDPFATPAGSPVLSPSPAAAPGDEHLVGGTGGFPFEAASPGKQPVLGFRCAVGSWAGKRALAQLDPIFERTSAASRSQQVIAKEGYVVGGLEFDATDLVHAVRVVFVRQKADGSLDPADRYTSDWLGTPSGNSPQTLSSGTARVTGIYGRKGAVIDAVGLVVEGRRGE